MPKVARFDTVIINDTVITDEGYLKATPVITKVGVFPYQMPDGTIRKEFRPPQEVLKHDSLETLKLLPATNGHPLVKLINSKTAKKYTVGHFGENVTHDGFKVKNSVVVTDSEAVAAIQDGKKQISMGYTADIVDEPGVWNGQRYDSVQKNIVYNHGAFVHRGRMGADASIKLDEGDAIQTDEQIINQPNNKEDKVMPENNLKSVVLDGIEYNAAPEVINALNKAGKSAAEFETKSKELQVKLDEVTAKFDSLKQKHEELETRDVEKEVISAAKNRISLLTSVKEVFNDEELKAVEDLSEREIKEAVLKKVIKNKISLDEKSLDYINARFDAEIEKIGDTKFANQRKAVHSDNITGDTVGASTAAYDSMRARLYKTKTAQKAN
jgi:hypothetical protein